MKGRGKPWTVYYNVRGERGSKLVGDKRSAESFASHLRRQIATGQFPPTPEQESDAAEDQAAKMPTFGVFAVRFLRHYARVACKYTTYRNYKGLYRHHLKPVWARLPLDKVTRQDVQKLLLRKRKEQMGYGTLLNIQAFASVIFSHAYEEGLIGVNPALRMKRIIGKDDRRESVKPLSASQVKALLSVIKEDHPREYPFFLCACRTGMRLGEITGLAWSDIDWDAGTITVRRSYTNGRWTSPKSHKSRDVEMSKQLQEVLREHHDRLVRKCGGKIPFVRMAGLKKGEELNQLVFPNSGGGVQDGSNVRTRILYPSLEKAGLPRVRFHDLRHTYASILLAKGTPIHWVKSQLGHQSIQVTIDIYGHVIPDANRGAANCLDDTETPALQIATA